MSTKRMAHWYVYMALLVIMGLLLSSGGAALAARPAPSGVPATAAAGMERVMVEFRPGRAPAVRSALEQAGGTIHYQFDDLSVFAVTLPSAALPGIERNPNVVLVDEDMPRYPMGQTTPWGIDSVQAPGVWDAGNTGSGVTVCVIDSGLYTAHEDLAGVHIKGGYSTGWNTDGCGHGTHVAGTIAAANNDIGVVGVSPDVSLYIVKVFGDNCSWAYSSDLIDATNRCVNGGGAKIISMSLGGGKGIGPWEERQFNTLYNNGILSVAAAGNAGNTQKSYPASYSSVVSVAATDINNVVADFSQKNDQVELSAPGVDVLSTVPWDATATLTVDSVTYQANHIENAKYGYASGALVDGGLCKSTGSWNGKVVLCERGDISFYDKVMNVQNSGGAAAVIYNNVSGSFSGTLGDATSTIPAISLSQDDGQYLVDNKLDKTGTVQSSSVKPASGYEAWDGTSMATPHVSGVAALLWSYNSSLTNVQIRNAMQATALDLGAPGRDNAYGYGLVQAYAALTYLGGGGPPPPPPPPTTGNIVGTVTGANGVAISGATVKIDETGQTVSTGNDGGYTLADVVVGTYSVTASATGYTSKTASIAVQTGDNTLNFDLAESVAQTMSVGSVTVTVVRRGNNASATATVQVISNGSPVSGAVVTGSWSLNDSPLGNASGTTNSSGVATIGSGNVRASSGNTFKFCVTNVVRDGYVWQSGAQDCGSGTVP